MNHCISGELFKWGKSLSYKVCLLVMVVLSLLSILTFVFTSRMYKTDKMQDNLHATYQEQGMDEQTIEKTIEELVTPSAFGLLSGALSGLNLLMLTGIFSSIFIASDYQGGTIRQIVSRGVSRHSIFLGKLVVTIIANIIIMIASVVVIFGGISIIFRVGEGPENLFLYLGKYLLTIILLATAYSSMAYFFAVLTKSLGGTVTCMVFIPIVGSVGLSLIDVIMKYKYHVSEYWVTNLPGIMLDFSVKNTEFLKCSGILLAIIVAFGAAGYLIFRKREF